MTRSRRDPRRGPAALDPLAEFGRNEPCWCDSGRKYKNCHLLAALSPPGAPVPEDTEDSIFVAPHTAVARDAFRPLDRLVPITTQVPVPQAAPVAVPDLARILAARAPTPGATSHAALASLRYALLDMRGVRDAADVRAGRHDAELERLRPELADGALDLARATFERLQADARRTEPPVVLRSDAPNVTRLVGATLLWADHYLLDDRLADLAVRGDEDPARWRRAVAGLLEFRPLVEAGIAVPTLFDLPLALLGDAVDRDVETELADSGYVAWLEQQVLVEGPTAREAAFVHLRDDYERDVKMYFLNRAVEGSAAETADGGAVQFRGRMLGRYDPTDDYGPWLATVRRQTLARAVRGLVSDVSAAHAVGAQYVTTSPFRARALARRPALSARRPAGLGISGAVWADVPWLPDADPSLLVRIASDEERVQDLRRSTARALRVVRQDDVAGSALAVAGVADDLRHAADRLSATLRRDLVGNGLVPAGIAAGSVWVAATFAAPVALGGVLAAASAGVPAARARRSARESAACVLARPAPPRMRRAAGAAPSRYLERHPPRIPIR